jgi:hypothetical protein
MASKTEDLETDEPNVLYIYGDVEMTELEEAPATCSNKDNIDELCFTVRSILIGILFVIAISCLHQWTRFSYNSIYIGQILGILLIFPFGQIWTLVVPKTMPFTQKEHGLIFIMINISWAYFSVFNYTKAVAVPLSKDNKPNFVYYFFLVLALQFIGLGLAGNILDYLYIHF